MHKIHIGKHFRNLQLEAFPDRDHIVTKRKSSGPWFSKNLCKYKDTFLSGKYMS